jgi:hypothetical protein
MKFIIYQDETGTILDGKKKDHFGLGYLICPFNRDKEIWDLLEKHKLDQIHTKNLRAPRRKIHIAQKVGALGLEKLGIMGGAVIFDPSRDHRQEVINRLAKVALPKVEKLVEHVNRDEKFKDNKKIILLPEIFPNFPKNNKLYFFSLYSLRLPIKTILFNYPEIINIEIDVYFSNVSEFNDYKSKMEYVLQDYENSLKEFLEKIKTNGNYPNLRPENLKITSLIAQKKKNGKQKDGPFGLADLFASVGHHLYLEKKDTTLKLGGNLYSPLQKILRNNPSLFPGLRPGIFYITKNTT